MTNEAVHYRTLSLALERETGYDSIPTIETHYQDYDRPGRYVCCFPDCGTRTRTAERMWLHIHFAVKHGRPFGAKSPEELATQAERSETP